MKNARPIRESAIRTFPKLKNLSAIPIYKQGNEGSSNVQNKIQLGETSPEFEDKIFTIADEVFKILRELSLENKKEIHSGQIAERMFTKTSLKGLLDDIHAITEDEGLESSRQKELSNLILNKFSELIPAYVAKKLGNLKEELHNKKLEGGPQEWIDSPFDIIKNYIDSISTRSSELENFLNRTTEHISTTDENMTRELSFQLDKFNDHIEFEQRISLDMKDIKQDLSGSDNLTETIASVTEKIEDICTRIEEKNKKDLQYISETKTALTEINRQMSEMKCSADEIRKKSKGKEYDASHDALTGAYNRKAYEKKIKEVGADVSRYGTATSMMLCDIDNLREINNKWGHKLGDLALRKLASLIKEWMRINDFVARYERDVFAVILPHTDLAGSAVAGERLRSHIDKANFSYKGETIPLTVSIGISVFREDDDMHSVFERARKALRFAKETGDNTVKTEAEAASRIVVSYKHD
jgi:diguanylate cyclase (GGDEF)-like protein